ncbi:zinc finger protein white collar 2 [Neurospora tetrasperma FGSC 2508]|uniref:Zinc finger protein white collar 2 n=1 Tax=Neurospora tetrasperma (strain FGSC 2508 / ATCC MYA-4615 / P0657) TaxID=510951 RepID=F8N099_NEUT8|nr:zinc finger protein white collar 2 [Neurospora tetrasperma FGSC 2508]EGO52130.1 zinc finger protein white collar 2 [Neurospora tetrasperma FGSC 2508]
MSHGQPPPGSSMYGFGAMGMGSGMETGMGTGMGTGMSASQMTSDPQDMMSLLDTSVFPGFDGMSMSLDVGDSMSNPFTPVSVPPPLPAGNAGPSHVGVCGGHGAPDQLFSPDDLIATSMSSAGPMIATPTTTTSGPSGGPSSGGGSTLTEFTKRRNWPAKVVEELQDWEHILDANGRIKHVSPSVEPLTGYKPPEIIDLFLRDLIHPDDVGVFTAELNEAIATGSQLRLFYRFRKKDGNWTIFETVGHAHIAAAKFAPNPQNQSPFCQAVFMMARPYPTKNAGLLDSFLEHKIENERLKRRIAELRREEQEEQEESQRTWRMSQEGRSDVTPSDDTATQMGMTPFYIPMNAQADVMMPPPSQPASSLNIALTRENLEGIAGSRPDSIREKMLRYEGNHADTIEMLTGLKYQEGERSHGITTGNASPTLIKGDAGIAIPLDRDPRTGEKKKKIKVAEEYVCTDCGTLDSPEWRKGPSGPKTLCNACGLRWAKKEKKKNANNNNNGGGIGGHNDIHTPMGDHMG